MTRNKARLFVSGRPFKLESPVLVEDADGSIFRWVSVGNVEGCSFAVLEHYGDSALETRLPLDEFLSTFTPFRRVVT